MQELHCKGTVEVFLTEKNFILLWYFNICTDCVDASVSIKYDVYIIFSLWRRLMHVEDAKLHLISRLEQTAVYTV